MYGGGGIMGEPQRCPFDQKLTASKSKTNMSIYELSHWPFSRGILKNTHKLITQKLLNMGGGGELIYANCLNLLFSKFRGGNIIFFANAELAILKS